MIPNDRFTRAYADGTFVVGTYGFEDVTVGGITVTRQQLALVNMTFWFGEGLTSGLMGLAYPLLTGLDGSGNDRPAYDPIFTSMWKRGLITAPLFSIALSRNDPPTAAGAANGTDVASLDANKGSYIAFGGIPPDIKYDDASWARAPVLGMEEIANIESSEPGMYIIKADAYVWGKGHDPKLTTSAGPPPDHLTVNTTQFPVIVDVGASVTILPTCTYTPLAHPYFVQASSMSFPSSPSLPRKDKRERKREQPRKENTNTSIQHRVTNSYCQGSLLILLAACAIRTLDRLLVRQV